MGTDDLLVAKKMGHSREISQLIAQWNANRLDLFEISQPNEEGEFHGVMRFYFQEAGSKVATKCIRVASTATAQAVIETLVEKFRPDMRMLSIPQYALYEIHENGEERRLEEQERPLLVQLNWHSDDREGRFLLRRTDEKVRYDFSMNKIQDIPADNTFKRKLSKREKKQLKKLQEKTKTSEASSVAEKLYTELPETSFTRSISNPEAVMRRRRQQKLEKKLAQFRSRDGGPDTGGTLKIYGESLCRDVPYKTLLLSVNDNAAYVVKEMLAKYGITDDPATYCLVQVCDGEGESILEDDESPLSILMNQPSSRGSVMFHVRRRPADFHPRKRKKKPGRRSEDEKGIGYRGSFDGQTEPLMIELLPDGSETGRKIPLESDVTEVGSDWGGLHLAGLRPRHCVIAHTDGIVTLTPSSRDSDIYVNGQRIYETTILHHGTIVRFGRTYYFRFSQRGRPFTEREVIEASQLKFGTDTGGGGMLTGHGGTISPQLSPQEENPMPRAIRPDSILPATLELPEEGEESFLGAVIINVSPSTLQFKLAPTYALYLAARYRATTHFRPEVTPHERAHLLSTFLLRVAHILMQVVQERNSDVNLLAFWMANASELLHFLKSDRQIGAFSLDAQDVLAEVVQLSFRHLVTCIQAEFASFVGHFLLERDEEDENATAPMMGVLISGMTLLRRCRVNAALTIQLFSQLFHFINMAIFNKLIVMDGRNYCSRAWGSRLRRRLSRIQTWAETQGLDLAADCHLVRVVQASQLLQGPKNSAEEVTTLASSCFKLNSLQLRCLLMKYQYESDEIPISPELLNSVIRAAETTVDEVIRADGRQIRVEEEPFLGLAFLLPEDGYSCDIVRGVPSGLVEFLNPLIPFCRLTPNPSAAGYWTIFFQDPMRSPSAMSGRSFATSFNNNSTALVPNTYNYNLSNSASSQLHPTSVQQTLVNSTIMGVTTGPNSSPMVNTGPIQNNKGPNEPEVQTIKLHKMTSGLGLSIVAAKGVGQDRLGIYIKSVVKGGSADMDGRLAAGDQLLNVDGQSLVGITQEKAAEYLVRTGPVVTLEVAKQAAIYQGLATMLSQPSPLMSRDFHAYDGTNNWKLSSESLRSRSNSQIHLHEKIIENSEVIVDSTGNLRSAFSESSISRVKSLEALSRRGLSDSAIGVPRIVGPSRLLKFFRTNNYHAHSTCTSPSREMRGGFNGHRRLSERDLPSKILQEHSRDMTDGSLHVMHGLLQPRIHSSKSVPALNSDVSGNAGDNRVVQNTLVPPPTIRSPGLMPGHHVESPSTSRYPHDYPSNVSATIQPQSKPVYRHGHTESMEIQHGGFKSRSIQSLTDPPHRSEIGTKQPSTPALNVHNEEDRFYQNVGYYQQPPPPSNPVNTPVRTYIPYSSSAGNVSSSGALRPPTIPNTIFHRGPPPNLNSSYHSDGSPSQHWQQDTRLHSHMQPHMNQNLLRQEAKMLEMQDELRRREERAAVMMRKAEQNYPGQRLNTTQGRVIYPGGIQPNMQQQQRIHYPPQTAPKPYRSGIEEFSPGRPPLPDEYRFSASMTEIPRGSFTPQGNKSDQLNPSAGNNPWSKEEKERELQRRKEATKYWRDQQILELESLGANRNPAQEEQLRAFRLEKEFQRRAEELNKRDEDDEGGDGDDDEDDRKAMVKRIQEDLERTRIHHGTSSLAPLGMNGNAKDMNEARARKIEEIKRKKLELEATQAAEERLVREAQKRREEEIRRQNQLASNQQQFTSYQSPYRSSYPSKMDTPASTTHPSSSEIILTPHNLIPTLPKSSPPALSFRGSAGSPQKSPVSPPQTSPKLRADKKSVSFNENVDTNEPATSMGMERVREDPNVFLTEATALLSSPRSPDGAGPGQFGNTPGVIGAQEVYRDPRWRRLAEQQHQKQTANTPKPEKLTFKEKMKMFAMETGEAETPKDKVKTSKAQREIETPVAITNNINNNGDEQQQS